MKSIESYYNGIIKDCKKWIYWDYNDNLIDEIKRIIPDFTSMYTDEKVQDLIEKLLHAGQKSQGSLADNIQSLANDRKRHIISLFFLGHILYDNIDIIKEMVAKQIVNLNFPEQNEQMNVEKIFSFMWILLCLFHDLGYDYEEGKKEIERANSLETIYSDLTKEFIPPIYNIDNVKKHDKYRLCKWGVKDHGIWGGKVFFNDMSQIKNLLRQTEGIVNTMFCSDGIEHIYAFAAWIIICHNLRYDSGVSPYSNCFKCQGLDDFIKPKARCISLQSNPLLFLFCLADTLEPTKILKSCCGNKESMNICKLLELDFTGNILSFNLENLSDYKAGDEYKKAILSMNDWLIDVNTNDLSIVFGK